MTCLLVLTLGIFQRDRGTHTLLQLLCEDAGEIEREILASPCSGPDVTPRQRSCWLEWNRIDSGFQTEAEHILRERLWFCLFHLLSFTPFADTVTMTQEHLDMITALVCLQPP
jgi:hypothetical protein